jgi:hypothetical protein
MLFRHRDTRFNSMAAKQAETKYSLRSLIDKLGVKPDASVAVLGIQDEGFLQQLKQRTSDVREDRLRKRLDTIFLLADNLEELEQLERLRDYLKSNGQYGSFRPKANRLALKTSMSSRPPSEQVWSITRSSAFPKPTPRSIFIGNSILITT